jgi:hypothetical protein
MDHSQALNQMAAERYLLNDLSPEVRDAFEEHFFDCPECAVDLRTAAAFIDEAKVQLPSLVPSQASGPVKRASKPGWWLNIWRPVFVVPAFAALLLALGFQNLVTLPGLRKHADQPQILAMTTLHGATRGGSPAVITASPTIGVGLAVDLSQEPGSAPVTAYVFDLIDAQGKQVWEGEVAAATSSQNASQRVSIGLPGPMLRNGVYTLVVSGAEAQGARTSLDRYSFNIALTK